MLERTQSQVRSLLEGTFLANGLTPKYQQELNEMMLN